MLNLACQIILISKDKSAQTKVFLMKLATWIIISVRVRLPLVLQFLQEADIDVLCLQETKTVN